MSAYTERFDRNMKGLTAASTGFTSTCSECVSNYGFTDEENDEGEVTRTAAEVAEAAYEAGKVITDTSFSWSACDACGSALGGDREPAHALTDDGKRELIHLSVCVDCVMYIANGDEPEPSDDDELDEIPVGTDGALKRDSNGRWPASVDGGYPIVYLFADGSDCCAACMNGENDSDASTAPSTDDQWRVIGADVFYEGAPRMCDHCGNEVESAYGVPDADAIDTDSQSQEEE